MNILYIAPQRILSGASLSLIGLVKTFSQKHEVTVLVEDETTEYAHRLRNAGAHVISCGQMPALFKYKSKCSLRWQLVRLVNCIRGITWRYRNKKIISILKSYNFNIIHSNLRLSVVGGILSKELNVPHIWHIREFGEEDFNIYPIISEQFACNYMNNYGDKIIAISHAICSKYSPYFGKKITTIANGVEVKQFYKKEHSIFCENKIKICMTSTLQPEKGQFELVKAIHLLPDAVKNRVEIVFAGACYDDIYIAKLKKYIQKNNLERMISFLGRVDNVEEILADSDILVVMSKSEGFGRVTVEGMLSGCLVIGTNTGATPEILENGKAGILVNYNSPENLRDAIVHSLSNIEESRSIAKTGREKAMRKYTITQNANAIFKTYEEVIEERGKYKRKV